jgi:hypothetical protein
MDPTVQQAAITRLRGMARGLYQQQFTWYDTNEDCAGHEFVKIIYNGTT